METELRTNSAIHFNLEDPEFCSAITDTLKTLDGVDVASGDMLVLEGPFIGLKKFPRLQIVDTPGWSDLAFSPDDLAETSGGDSCPRTPTPGQRVLFPLAGVQRLAADADIIILPSGSSGRLPALEDINAVLRRKLLFGSDYHDERREREKNFSLLAFTYSDGEHPEKYVKEIFKQCATEARFIDRKSLTSATFNFEIENIRSTLFGIEQSSLVMPAAEKEELEFDSRAVVEAGGKVMERAVNQSLEKLLHSAMQKMMTYSRRMRNGLDPGKKEDRRTLTRKITKTVDDFALHVKYAHLTAESPTLMAFEPFFREFTDYYDVEQDVDALLEARLIMTKRATKLVREVINSVHSYYMDYTCKLYSCLKEGYFGERVDESSEENSNAEVIDLEEDESTTDATSVDTVATLADSLSAVDGSMLAMSPTYRNQLKKTVVDKFDELHIDEKNEQICTTEKFLQLVREVRTSFRDMQEVMWKKAIIEMTQHSKRMKEEIMDVYVNTVFNETQRNQLNTCRKNIMKIIKDLQEITKNHLAKFQPSALEMQNG